MATVGVHEAKTHLSRLIEQVEAGHEVVIARRGTPVVRLVPVAASRRDHFGNLRGEVWVAEDFDGPLSDDDLSRWYDGPMEPPSADPDAA